MTIIPVSGGAFAAYDVVVGRGLLAQAGAHIAPLAKGRTVIVTDGVFSMDGYYAPLPEICDLAEEFGAPQDYAARFRPDRGRRLRWEAILLTAADPPRVAPAGSVARRRPPGSRRSGARCGPPTGRPSGAPSAG